MNWSITPIEDVEIIYRWESWHITAAWPQRSRRSDVSTILQIRHLAPDRLVMSSTRLNLLSGSAKNGIAVALRRIDESGGMTDQFIHEMCENLLEWFRQSGTTKKVAPKQREGDRWLLYPIWPSTGGTLIAAGTNSFKSFITAAAAVQTTTGVEVLAGNTRCAGTTPILFLDWEADEHDFAERLYSIHRGAGIDMEPSVAYRQLTVPLSDAAETIREEIAREGYGGVIIDSLSAACGGSLVDDELANQFWNAVSRLGVPALVTAHKSAESLNRQKKKAFGSVMHENRSRMLWDATRDPQEDLVVWEVVSDNNTGRKGHKVAWRVNLYTEGDEDARRLEAVVFQAVNPRDVRVAPNEGDTLADRITYALVANGPMTAGEIASQVGTKDGSVRAQLSRHAGLFVKADDGQRWTMK